MTCPACTDVHLFDKRWTYNGDPEKPTFSPSMLVYSVEGFRGRCHSFLRDGVWQFLDDCEHALKGTNVPAPDFSWGD